MACRESFENGYDEVTTRIEAVEERQVILLDLDIENIIRNTTCSLQVLTVSCN